MEVHAKAQRREEQDVDKRARFTRWLSGAFHQNFCASASLRDIASFHLRIEDEGEVKEAVSIPCFIVVPFVSLVVQTYTPVSALDYPQKAARLPHANHLPMPAEFPYDVFLSHSAQDKRSKPPTLMHDTGGNAVVRDVAERLRKDGQMSKAEGRRMKVEVPPHPSAFTLHPCPDWAQLQTHSQLSTFHSQPTPDPLNKERRFLPLRLDDAPIKGPGAISPYE